MKKITEEACKAFINREVFNKSNTKVFKEGDRFKLSLFGNVIAYITEFNELFIRDADWRTVTTKERLNGLPGVHIVQKKGIWYLNNNEWNGDWIKIN